MPVDKNSKLSMEEQLNNYHRKLERKSQEEYHMAYYEDEMLNLQHKKLEAK